MNNTAYLEAVVDMATAAGWMLAKNEIKVLDSRELVQFIIDAAEEFETLNAREDWSIDDDYMDEIDKFAAESLLKQYGVKK